jgi:CheY-like chemotaxis protein
LQGAASVTDVRRKILIIDDQPTLAKAIRRMLGEYDVAIVASGREALDKIEAGERYDVILSDVMMPEISGMDLHRMIATIAPDQVDKMVFMTGGAFTKQAREFFEKVANPTLEKPFDRAALMTVLGVFLR